MSKIEVNTVDTQCGTNLTVGSACKSVTVAGNDIRSNAYKAGDGGNLVSQSGTTITLGASGDTVSLASGASQTGFGRTGTVDWDTTPKTATFSAVSGDGFFCNTTAGAFTCNLPAGSAGAIVSLADYAGTWDSNNLTVSPNGSEKIGGTNANVDLNTEGQSVTFVYVDSTQGWINTMDSTSNERGNAFIAATGGTITTCGNFKIHTFTGPGTFTVSSAGTPTNANVDYLVVAGGAGGATGSGGGGAGGYRESHCASVSGPYTASPLATPTSLPVTATGYPITVGAGGAASTTSPTNRFAHKGNNSIFSSITATGGGGLTSDCEVTPTNGAGKEARPGSPGGSGGGAGLADGSTQTGGSGNTPPVSPPQGNNGGDGGNPGASGGGGGAGAAGGNGGPTYNSNAGPGGNGTTSSINGTPTTRAGGGGGGGWMDTVSPAPGGSGGGGAGAGPSGNSAVAGSTNTGGGGGGDSLGSSSGGGAAGGSGIVIIRYKYQ